jgi:glycine betaine/proline transport system permease protein
VFLGALWLSFQNDSPSKFPKQITDEFTFTAWVNDGEDYLKKNYRWITKLIANYIKEGYYVLEDFLIDSPWLLIAAILFFPCLIAGGLKLGLYSMFVGLFLGCGRNVGRVNANLGFNGIVSFFMCVFWSYSRNFMFSK